MFCVDIASVCVCVFLREWQNVISFWLKFTTISFVVSHLVLLHFSRRWVVIVCVHAFFPLLLYSSRAKFAFDFHCLFYHLLLGRITLTIRSFERNTNVNSQRNPNWNEEETVDIGKFLDVRIVRLKRYWANASNPSNRNAAHIHIHTPFRHIWKGDEDVLCQSMNRSTANREIHLIHTATMDVISLTIQQKKNTGRERERVRASRRRKIRKENRESGECVCSLFGTLGVPFLKYCGWNFDSKIRMILHFIRHSVAIIQPVWWASINK